MLLTEMAMSRDQWINSVRKKIEGALGEYAKLRYFVDYGMPCRGVSVHLYSTQGILRQVEILFQKKTKSSFDKDKAFLEAVEDARGCQEQVVNAKNQILHTYLKTPTQRESFLRFFKGKTFDCDELMFEMLERFSPELFGRLQTDNSSL